MKYTFNVKKSKVGNKKYLGLSKYKAITAFAVFALITALVPVATLLAQPPGGVVGTTATYEFVFVNGTVISGTVGGGDVYLDEEHPEINWPEDGLELHVSCSESFPNGWATGDKFPNETNHSDWRIASYSITRILGAGQVRNCGETFVPGNVKVIKNTSPETSSEFTFDLHGDIPPAPGTDGTQWSEFDDTQEVAGNGGEYTWERLEAGNYTLGEDDLNNPGNYELDDLTCTSVFPNFNFNNNNGSASFTLHGGETVTCTFTNTSDQSEISADLAITKTVDESAPDAGDTIVYTLTVNNNGPDDATNVEVTDQLPSEVSYVSDDSSGDYVSGTGIWTIGNLDNGDSVTLNITVTVNQGTEGQTFVNTASVEADENDPNLDNNSDTASVTVNRAPDPGAPEADLEIEKSANVETVLYGGTVVYTITVTNNGPDEAQNVVMSDILPSCMEFVSADPDDFDEQNNSWNIGTLSNDAVATIEITVTANCEPGAVENTATVSSDTNDPNNTNNSASASVTVTQQVGPQTFPLTVETLGTGTGTITSDVGGIDCPPTGGCTDDYDENTLVTLTATPDSGSTFAGWNGACSGTDPVCVVTMDEAKSVTATFNLTPPPIITGGGGGGGGGGTFYNVSLDFDYVLEKVLLSSISESVSVTNTGANSIPDGQLVLTFPLVLTVSAPTADSLVNNVATWSVPPLSPGAKFTAVFEVVGQSTAVGVITTAEFRVFNSQIASTSVSENIVSVLGETIIAPAPEVAGEQELPRTGIPLSGLALLLLLPGAFLARRYTR